MKRKNGEGQLVFKNKIWHFRYKNRQVSLGVSDKFKAEFKAEMALDAIKRGEGWKKAKESVGIPLREVWELFASRSTCGDLTLLGYRSKWKGFLRFLKTKFPNVSNTKELTPEHGEAFRVWLVNRTKWRIGAYTANRHLKWTNYILKKAAGIAPFSAIERLQNLDKPKRQGFTEEELLALQKVFDDASIECMYKSEMETIHHIGLHTGLRLSDCCLLRWESIDFKKAALTVTPTKTRRYDTVLCIPIGVELDAALKKAEIWKDESGYVCPHVASRYNYNRCGVSQDYTWLLHRAGIQTEVERKGRAAQVLRSFHSLRHTFVSRLAEKGVSPLVIQSMSGHTTMAMTNRYSHISIEAKRRALEGTGSAPVSSDKIPPNDGEPHPSTEEKLKALRILLAGQVDPGILKLLDS